MNERILELAKNDLIRDEYTEFGWQECHYYRFDPDELQKFAELIVAEEREACAKVCEDSINAIFEFSDEIVKETAHNVCINLAKGIRARGNE